jgi:hypothetical protein
MAAEAAANIKLTWQNIYNTLSIKVCQTQNPHFLTETCG